MGVGQTEAAFRRMQQEQARMALAAQPLHLGLLGWKSWAFILAAAAMFTWFMVSEMNAWEANMKADMVRYRAFMRECVPTQPERRCGELWRWTKQ